MPLTGEMLNEQGNATCREEKPAISPKWASIGESEKEVSVETETAASGKKFKKTSHGLVTKNLVVVTELNGKTLKESTVGETVGGLVLGAPYWVREINANEFCIAYTKSQAETSEAECVEYTAAIKTTTKFTKVVELSVKKRVEVKYKAAKNLTNESEAATEIESEANSQKVTWELYYSAETVGTLTLVNRVYSGAGEPETKELAKGDLFKITSTKVQQNGYVL